MRVSLQTLNPATMKVGMRNVICSRPDPLQQCPRSALPFGFEFAFD